MYKSNYRSSEKNYIIREVNKTLGMDIKCNLDMLSEYLIHLVLIATVQITVVLRFTIVRSPPKPGTHEKIIWYRNVKMSTIKSNDML